MTHPKVAIIILNWNGLADTLECLDSLKKLEYPNYYLVLVDNGSDGNDARVLGERCGDTAHLIVNPSNLGYAGGTSAAIKYAAEHLQPDYYLILNNDTTVDPSFLSELVSVAESNADIGIVGPKTYLYDDPARFWLVWFDLDMRWGRTVPVGLSEPDRGQYGDVREVAYLPGACLLLKNRLVENIGAFDESYVNYWDETDYCFRTRQAGYRIVYVPKARIWHKVAQTQKKVTGYRWYYRARNNFKFMKKYATRKQYCSFLLYFFGFHVWLVSYLCLVRQRGDFKALSGFWRGVRDGISNKVS